MTPSLLYRFTQRLLKYSLAGGSTFAIDLLLLSLFSAVTTIDHSYLIVSSFLIGSSLNYLICYYWVYRGTSQTKTHGYIYFLSFAIVTSLLILVATDELVVRFSLPLIVARICVGVIVGCVNFLLNTFLNFKLL